MPRSPEDSAQIRQQRAEQILDAALSVYVRCGYTGCDMDMVAAQADLPKGLVYYYFKTKQQLFTALFNQMLQLGMAQNETCLSAPPGASVIERLTRYILENYRLAAEDPRHIRFYMRMPFDAFAIFGADHWQEGVKSSKLHQASLAALIEEGMQSGQLPPGDPNRAAASFWAVLVADLLSFPALIAGQDSPRSIDPAHLEGILQFCFGGLGIDRSQWQNILDTLLKVTDPNL